MSEEGPHCNYERELQPELGILFDRLDNAPEEYIGRAWDIVGDHLGAIISYGDRIDRHMELCQKISDEIRWTRAARGLPEYSNEAEEFTNRLPKLSAIESDNVDAALVCAAQISCTLFPSLAQPKNKKLNKEEVALAQKSFALRRWRGETLSAILLKMIPPGDREIFRRREYRNYILHSDEKIDHAIFDTRPASYIVAPGDLTGRTTIRMLHVRSGDPSKEPISREFDNTRYLSIALLIAERAKVAQNALMNWSIYRHSIGEETSAGGHYITNSYLA